jgi:hypothetical protein
LTVRISKSIIAKHSGEADEYPDTAIVEFDLDHNDPMKRERIQIESVQRLYRTAARQNN